ncbi:MAG: cytochrome c3 family protein [Planctomycetes bacterium]|nr:cytochrome c3 family protein [Planctomycetota bacterium]
MKRSYANLAIAAISTLAVVGLVFKDVQRSSPSPGDLSVVHGRIDDLQGASGCNDCHGDSKTSRASACLACHEAIDQNLAQGTGLHGSLAKNVRQACNLCHSEHHGPGFALVNARTFLLAGVEDVAAFDHERVGFAMGGAHAALACEECHTQAEAQPLPEGATRYMGLAQDCSTCHADPHQTAMRVACAECHNQTDFHTFEGYEHPGALNLVGGHEALACSECHTPEGPHAIEAVARRGAKVEARSCAGCHADPHSGSFLEGVADLVVERNGAIGCALCHQEGDHAFADSRTTLEPALHAASGLALLAPHANLDCAQCHGDLAQPFAERFPGRLAEHCQDCHADPHGGQFAKGPFAEPGCVTCHGTQSFEPHGFTPAMHARTAFALEGAHATQACEACHKLPGAQAPRQFAGTDASCAACHEDVHQGAFAAQACSTCHDSVKFGGEHARAFDHGKFTGFALKGAHAQNACESCHRTDSRGPATIQTNSQGAEPHRALGRIADIFGPVHGCASCHADPHGGHFGRAGEAPSEGCATCHDEVSFRLAAEQFEHGRFTGFALDGAHGELDCSACHAPMLRPDPLGRTWGEARGARCSDCHSDPHADQFGPSRNVECATCHGTAGGFDQLVFDHDRDSRFALDEAHRQLDCAACHKRQGKGEQAFTRYKPLGVLCVDCHGQDRKELPRGKGQ